MHRGTVMKISALICASVGLACVSPAPDEGSTTQDMQRSETIDVYGCMPGFWQIGEGENTTCIEDPTLRPTPRGGNFGEGWGQVEPHGWGGGGGGQAPAAAWTCNASCNVQQDDPRAPCPDRVTGRGTGPSSREACLAAQRDANSKVPGVAISGTAIVIASKEAKLHLTTTIS